MFPLASNEEQYKVVRQTNDSNLGLVQEPPGTGKSHTIANLISNYVSYGRKILVTSEKSKAKDNEKIYFVPKVKKSTYTYIESENK